MPEFLVHVRRTYAQTGQVLVAAKTAEEAADSVFHGGRYGRLSNVAWYAEREDRTQFHIYGVSQINRYDYEPPQEQESKA